MKKRYTILAKCFDKKGNLLSSATNSYRKSHPFQAFLAARVGKPEYKWLHAEVLAILRARGKPIYRITIERYDNEGFPALAAPCIICREAMKIFNIKIVEYTK